MRSSELEVGLHLSCAFEKQVWFDYTHSSDTRAAGPARAAFSDVSEWVARCQQALASSTGLVLRPPGLLSAERAWRWWLRMTRGTGAVRIHEPGAVVLRAVVHHQRQGREDAAGLSSAAHLPACAAALLMLPQKRQTTPFCRVGVGKHTQNPGSLQPQQYCQAVWGRRGHGAAHGAGGTLAPQPDGAAHDEW